MKLLALLATIGLFSLTQATSANADQAPNSKDQQYSTEQDSALNFYPGSTADKISKLVNATRTSAANLTKYGVTFVQGSNESQSYSLRAGLNSVSKKAAASVELVMSW